MPFLRAITQRITALWVILGLQAACAAFFLLDALSDWISALRGVALGLTFREIRRLLRRQKRMGQQLRAASGAFAQLLDEHFDEWALTPSERDVALLAIKGLSIAEMAALRSTKEGTIKSQCNAIYRKAGVSGRLQLLSLFVEELVADGMPAGTASPPQGAA
ncbi:MAG: helix-turn-helix transcriptional regulator [Alphaproteobacteria bacterium]|nr:helix-turn-helix transcriptional regulator [Alphaproteobacteria bacterium]MCB9929399.1 helix-turn-helix transcriptional regulator [Alphaproteobacteria bacterium]